MTGWEVQALKEADDARIWEELNAPDPYEKQMEDSAREMRLAVEMIGKAEDYLMDAVSAVNDTPMEDRVSSLLNDLEDLHIGIFLLAEKYQKGVRA